MQSRKNPTKYKIVIFFTLLISIITLTVGISEYSDTDSKSKTSHNEGILYLYQMATNEDKYKAANAAKIDINLFNLTNLIMTEDYEIFQKFGEWMAIHNIKLTGNTTEIEKIYNETSKYPKIHTSYVKMKMFETTDFETPSELIDTSHAVIYFSEPGKTKLDEITVHIGVSNHLEIPIGAVLIKSLNIDNLLIQQNKSDKAFGIIDMRGIVTGDENAYCMIDGLESVLVEQKNKTVRADIKTTPKPYHVWNALDCGVDIRVFGALLENSLENKSDWNQPLKPGEETKLTIKITENTETDTKLIFNNFCNNFLTLTLFHHNGKMLGDETVMIGNPWMGC